MNREKLIEAGIDYDTGLNRFCDDKALYESFLIDFHNDESIAGLDEAMKNKNTEKAIFNAHALKGVAGNLGINNLFTSFTEVLQALRAGNFTQASKLYEIATEQLKEMNEAIDSAK